MPDRVQVLGDICGAGFIDELGMTNGIHSVLIDPRIKAGIVQILDFLTNVNLTLL